MAERCPKCRRGRIETYGVEVAALLGVEKREQVIGEIPMFRCCSKCDWTMPIPKDEQGFRKAQP